MGTDGDILTDCAVLPDARSFEDMSGMPNAGPRADLPTFVDKDGFVGKV